MNKKKLIIEKLKGNFNVTNIRRDDYAGHPAVIIYFEKNGKEGVCTYTLYGEDSGIEECDYNESDGEDIYGEIHEWIEEHLIWNLKIKCDGKLVDY